MTPEAVSTRRPAACNRLAEGSSGQLLVAADFSAAGRSTATFAELAVRLHAPHAVWETALPAFGDDVGMTGRNHVEWWVAEIERHDVEVRAVLGFCVASVFAATLTERLGQRQSSMPQLIVLDPQWPDLDLVHAQYEKLVTGRLASVLTADEVERARQDGIDARWRNEDMHALAGALGRLVREVAAPAFERLRLDATRGSEFIDVFNAFLRYLAAAGDLTPVDVWGDAVAITSSTPDTGLDVLPDARRARAVGREIRVESPYADLLRSDEVAAVIDELVT